MRSISELVKTVPLSAIMVFTPGQPTQMITGTGSGYMITESGRGVTQVLEVGGVTMVSRPDGPTQFILGAPLAPVMPALPTSPARPNGLDLLLPPPPPGLPTGPNNEYEM